MADAKPEAAVPDIAGLLATFGIPPEGIGSVLGADRILDMMRTMINVEAGLVTAPVVDAQTGDIESRPAAPC